MTQALHMMSLKPDRTEFLTQAVLRKTIPRSGDMGYALHQMLTGLFGDAAPKPFQLFDEQNFQILGYTLHPKATLLDYAQRQKTLFADWPRLDAALNLPSLDVRTLPASWQPERYYHFRVRTRPVIRINRSKQRGFAGECDVFLRRIETKTKDSGTWLDRKTVYLDWFRSQIPEAAASLQAVKLLAMKRTAVYRKGAPSIEGPDVTFSGVMQVHSSSEFSVLLARGIGRHRAFGFGMVLLSPADTEDLYVAPAHKAKGDSPRALHFP